MILLIFKFPTHFSFADFCGLRFSDTVSFFQINEGVSGGQRFVLRQHDDLLDGRELAQMTSQIQWLSWTRNPKYNVREVDVLSLHVFRLIQCMTITCVTIVLCFSNSVLHSFYGCKQRDIILKTASADPDDISHGALLLQ